MDLDTEVIIRDIKATSEKEAREKLLE